MMIKNYLDNVISINYSNITFNPGNNNNLSDINNNNIYISFVCNNKCFPGCIIVFDN